MERKPGSQENIYRAYRVLDSLYKVATNYEIPAPLSILSAVREFPDGSIFKISKNYMELHVQVTEKNGEEIHLGIYADGLSSIETVSNKGKRDTVTVKDIKKNDDIEHVNRFKEFVIDITPWIIERYIGENPKPFPKLKILKKFIA